MTSRNDTTSALVEYRDILDFPGYRAVDDGRVQSCLAVGNHPAGTLTGKWVDLKGKRSKSGHINVSLRRAGRTHSRWVHRLILEAFVGPCPPGMECCHDPDPDPSNNRLENLRWDTHKANEADKDRHGRRRYFPNPGVLNGRAKLTEADVLDIRRLHLQGVSYSRLGEVFGVDKASIAMIVRRNSWKHLPGAMPPVFDQRGERGPGAKLSEGDVLDIRRLIAEGATQKDVAARFGVARSNVGLIANRRSWGHLP